MIILVWIYLPLFHIQRYEKLHVRMFCYELLEGGVAHVVVVI